MILCCGEALIDMIPDETGKGFIPHAGGSVFNTAIGLGRQGMDVSLLSGVSTDLFGQQLCATLQESGVMSDTLMRSERPTTLAFVRLVEGSAEYAFYDENTAGRMIRESDMPQTLDDNVKALFFGGISLAVMPCADVYAKFLKSHHESCLIMVDPNIRPSFIKDENAFRTRLDAIFACADIIKISDEDLGWLDKSNRPVEEKAKSLLEGGPSFICLTQGAKPPLLVTQQGILRGETAEISKVVDTIGAGDAFNAGFLTSLQRSGCLSKKSLKNAKSQTLQAALNFASKFASDTVTRAGSDPAWHFAI